MFWLMVMPLAKHIFGRIGGKFKAQGFFRFDLDKHSYRKIIVQSQLVRSPFPVGNGFIVIHREQERMSDAGDQGRALPPPQIQFILEWSFQGGIMFRFFVLMIVALFLSGCAPK
jgi:hypothetical protein